MTRINQTALVSRRALYPKSPYLVRTWTQTRRAGATRAPITDEAKPESADTLCPPFCLNPSCKRPLTLPQYEFIFH